MLTADYSDDLEKAYNSIYNYYGFITRDNATKKMLQRVAKCVENNSDIVWIEGEAGTGKSKLSRIIAQQQAAHHQHLSHRFMNITLKKPEQLLDIYAEVKDGCNSLCIYLHPSIKVDAIHQLQQQMVTLLGQYRHQLNLVCFTSHTAPSYESDVAHVLGVMKQLLVERQYEYISIQPLRNRIDDIPLLVQCFHDEFSEACDTHPAHIAADAVQYLQRQEWKRNVKDLQDFCLRAVQYDHNGELSLTAAIELLELSDQPKNQEQSVIPATQPMSISLLNSLGRVRPFADLEVDIVAKACQYYRGSKSAAARDLGMGRTTLYRKLGRQIA